MAAFRPATLRADRLRRDTIDLGHQGCDVDVRPDPGKWITQGVDRLAVIGAGKQAGLDGATRLHRGGWQRGSGRQDSAKQRVASLNCGLPDLLEYQKNEPAE